MMSTTTPFATGTKAIAVEQRIPTTHRIGNFLSIFWCWPANFRIRDFAFFGAFRVRARPYRAISNAFHNCSSAQKRITNGYLRAQRNARLSPLAYSRFKTKLIAITKAFCENQIETKLATLVKRETENERVRVTNAFRAQLST